MNYYNYHIGDYRTATAHLTLEEDATYKRLIDYQYDKEAPILDDPAIIARRIRSTEPLVRSMLCEFFTLTDSGWIHRRVMEEVHNHHEFLQKQAHNGKKGGTAKRSVSGGQAVANPSPSLPIPNTQLPSTNKESETDFSELPSVLNTPEFKQAWDAFLKYRKERKKTLYKSSFLPQWKQMAKWGVEEAIEAMNISIANGWQGIFPPDQREKQKEKPEHHSKYKNIF